jgi:hypothetical protein
MSDRTSLTFELIGAWCGPLFVLTFVFSFGLLGHNLPVPPSPSLNPADLAARYARYWSDLRLGWVISLVFISLYMPWTAQIGTQMRQAADRATLEGPDLVHCNLESNIGPNV